MRNAVAAAMDALIDAAGDRWKARPGARPREELTPHEVASGVGFVGRTPAHVGDFHEAAAVLHGAKGDAVVAHDFFDAHPAGRRLRARLEAAGATVRPVAGGVAVIRHPLAKAAARYARNRVGTTHAEADAFLGTRNQRRLAANKLLHRDAGGDVHVRLHGTDVVTYHKDGSVTVRTGGYNTNTTRQTIQDYTGLRTSFAGGKLRIGGEEFNRGEEHHIPAPGAAPRVGYAHEDFLRRIAENPAEATAHLAYADWLREQGQPGAAELVERHVTDTRAGVVHRGGLAAEYRSHGGAGGPAVDLYPTLPGDDGEPRYVLRHTVASGGDRLGHAARVGAADAHRLASGMGDTPGAAQAKAELERRHPSLAAARYARPRRYARPHVPFGEVDALFRNPGHRSGLNAAGRALQSMVSVHKDRDVRALAAAALKGGGDALRPLQDRLEEVGDPRGGWNWADLGDYHAARGHAFGYGDHADWIVLKAPGRGGDPDGRLADLVGAAVKARKRHGLVGRALPALSVVGSHLKATGRPDVGALFHAYVRSPAGGYVPSLSSDAAFRRELPGGKQILVREGVNRHAGTDGDVPVYWVSVGTPGGGDKSLHFFVPKSAVGDLDGPGRYARLRLLPGVAGRHVGGEPMFTHEYTDEAGAKLGVAKVVPRGDGRVLHVDWVGPESASPGEVANTIGPEESRGLLRQLAAHYPDAEFVTGIRAGGARKGSPRRVLLPLRYGRGDGVAHPLVRGLKIEYALRHLHESPETTPETKSLASAVLHDGDLTALAPLHDSLVESGHPFQKRDWHAAQKNLHDDAVLSRVIDAVHARVPGRGPEHLPTAAANILYLVHSGEGLGPHYGNADHADAVAAAREGLAEAGRHLTGPEIARSLTRHGERLWHRWQETAAPGSDRDYVRRAVDPDATRYARTKSAVAEVVRGTRLAVVLRRLAKDRDDAVRATARAAAATADGTAFGALHDRLEEVGHPVLALGYDFRAAGRRLQIDAAVLGHLRRLAAGTAARMGTPDAAARGVHHALAVHADHALSGAAAFAEERDAAAAAARAAVPDATDAEVRGSVLRAKLRASDELLRLQEDRSHWDSRRRSALSPGGSPPDSYYTHVREANTPEAIAASRFRFARGGDFLSALRRVRGKQQAVVRRLAEQVAERLRLTPTVVRDAVHDGPAGALAGVAQSFRHGDRSLARVAASWFGLHTRSPSMAVFHVGEGPDLLHRVTASGSGDRLRAELDRHGLTQRTMLPDGGGWQVLLYDPGGRDRRRAGRFAAAVGGHLRTAAGEGEILGHGDPEKARAAFRAVIAAHERGTQDGRVRPATAGGQRASAGPDPGAAAAAAAAPAAAVAAPAAGYGP